MAPQNPEGKAQLHRDVAPEALPCPAGTTGACVRPHRLLEGSPPSRGPPALSRALEMESHHQLKLADLNQIPAGDKKRVVSRANDRAWSPLEEERTAEAGRTEKAAHKCPANRICHEGCRERDMRQHKGCVKHTYTAKISASPHPLLQTQGPLHRAPKPPGTVYLRAFAEPSAGSTLSWHSLPWAQMPPPGRNRRAPGQPDQPHYPASPVAAQNQMVYSSIYYLNPLSRTTPLQTGWGRPRPCCGPATCPQRPLYGWGNRQRRRGALGFLDLTGLRKCPCPRGACPVRVDRPQVETAAKSAWVWGEQPPLSPPVLFPAGSERGPLATCSVGLQGTFSGTGPPPPGTSKRGTYFPKQETKGGGLGAEVTQAGAGPRGPQQRPHPGGGVVGHGVPRWHPPGKSIPALGA